MNKYEEAHYEMHRLFSQIPYSVNVIKVLPLKELVDRATPTKPKITYRYVTTGAGEVVEVEENRCPNCDRLLIFDGCCVINDCRQAIDWSGNE